MKFLGALWKFVVGLPKAMWGVIADFGKLFIKKDTLIFIAIVVGLVLLFQFALPMLGYGAGHDFALKSEDTQVAFGGSTPGEEQDKYNPPPTGETPGLPGDDLGEEPELVGGFWGAIWADRTDFEKFLELVVLGLINHNTK